MHTYIHMMSCTAKSVTELVVMTSSNTNVSDYLVVGTQSDWTKHQCQVYWRNIKV